MTPPTGPLTRVGIVDDDPLLLQLLASQLAREDLSVVWALEPEAALQEFSQDSTAIDVLLVDIKMPTIDGFQFTRQALSIDPEAIILMLTSLDDASSLAQSLSAGAVGFLVKADPAETIAAAIVAAAAGLRPLSRRAPDVMPTLEEADVGLEGREPLPSPLTQREVEVLELLARSLTNDQVARRLGISVDTVKRHVSAILAKLDVQDRLGAVMWGVRNRIIGLWD